MSINIDYRQRRLYIVKGFNRIVVFCIQLDGSSKTLGSLQESSLSAKDESKIMVGFVYGSFRALGATAVRCFRLVQLPCAPLHCARLTNVFSPRI